MSQRLLALHCDDFSRGLVSLVMHVDNPARAHVRAAGGDSALSVITEAQFCRLETGPRRQQLKSRAYGGIEIDFSGGDQI